MSAQSLGLMGHGQNLFQRISLVLIGLLAGVLIAASIGATLGMMPWLEFTARFGDLDVANAGVIAQLGFTAFVTSLLFFLPANARMLRLEGSHRDFNLRMEDVQRAYRAAHEEDRKKLFKIGSEFDAVRERIAHLRDHPDLGALEPEVLELAAQMSFESRDLAQIYSDEKVSRAKGFLKQRQEELDQFQENLALANSTVGDMRRWMLQLDTEETVAKGQMEVLEKDLMELLPKLGYELGFEERPVQDATVVPLAAQRGKTAEKQEAH